MTDRLTEMEAFVRAAELGSFARAAVRLGISAQMVGKHVAALEARLGARLLHRSTRRQSVTEAGQAFLAGCRRTLAEADAAEAEVAAQGDRPAGTLRIAAPVAFGTACLVPEATRLLARHPGLRLRFELSDRRVDLIEEGFDVAVRIGGERSSSLGTRALAPYRLLACAAPDYVARRGMPMRPEELEAHDCLGYVFAARPGLRPWVFERAGEAPVSIDPALRLGANDARALIGAAIDGGGIVLLADHLLAPHLAAGRLVRVLPDHVGPSRPMRLVFALAKARSPALRVFIDWAAERFGRRDPRGTAT